MSDAPVCSRCDQPAGAFLTPQQAAACLNVPLATMRYWIHRVRLVDKYTVGLGRGHVRVLHSDLEALVRVQRQRGTVTGIFEPANPSRTKPPRPVVLPGLQPRRRARRRTQVA